MKHIKVTILFVKDKVDVRDVVIKDCPTKVVWADTLTKLKQEKSFREMRAVLVNCPVDYINNLDVRSQQRGITKSSVGRSGFEEGRSETAKKRQSNESEHVAPIVLCRSVLGGSRRT